MTFAEIDQVIAAMQANGVTRLEWGHLTKGTRLRLGLPASNAQPPANQKPISPEVAVIAPTIGTFAARGGHDGLPPLAASGRVQAGETLGYLAQGPVLHVLIASCSGAVAGALPDAGQVFGYGETVLHLTGAPE